MEDFSGKMETTHKLQEERRLQNVGPSKDFSDARWPRAHHLTPFWKKTMWKNGNIQKSGMFWKLIMCEPMEST